MLKIHTCEGNTCEIFQSLKLGETCIIHEKTLEAVRSDGLQSITLFHEGKAQKFTKFSKGYKLHCDCVIRKLIITSCQEIG